VTATAPDDDRPPGLLDDVAPETRPDTRKPLSEELALLQAKLAELTTVLRQALGRASGP
jgi:hypothetical protein